MFKSQYRVYYEDTDAAGVMYYANYLKFAERNRTDALISLGIDQEAMLRQEGLGFVVSKAEVDYHQPARLGDEVLIETHVTELGRARVCMEQYLMRDSTRLSTVKVTVAMIDQAGKPQRIPEPLEQALKTLQKE